MDAAAKMRAWNKERTFTNNSLFTETLQGHGFNYEQIIAILETIDEVCHECWDSPTGCQCWNDE